MKPQDQFIFIPVYSRDVRGLSLSREAAALGKGSKQFPMVNAPCLPSNKEFQYGFNLEMQEARLAPYHQGKALRIYLFCNISKHFKLKNFNNITDS